MELTPEAAAFCAHTAVRITRNITGVELDYSPESLKRVDELIEGFRAEGHTAESMYETIYMFGCYFGEVIIRNDGGQWKLASETGFSKLASEEDYLVVEMPNKMVWNPIGKAFKLLQNGLDDSLVFFYQALTHMPESSKQD
jgi:hypothetical protein